MIRFEVKDQDVVFEPNCSTPWRCGGLRAPTATLLLHSAPALSPVRILSFPEAWRRPPGTPTKRQCARQFGASATAKSRKRKMVSGATRRLSSCPCGAWPLSRHSRTRGLWSGPPWRSKSLRHSAGVVRGGRAEAGYANSRSPPFHCPYTSMATQIAPAAPMKLHHARGRHRRPSSQTIVSGHSLRC